MTNIPTAHTQCHNGLPVLLVDTREQTPLDFSPYKERFGGIVRMKLDAGDYSLLGQEHAIAFERKSLGDLVSTLTQNQPRFFAELDRLKHYRYAAILIEASYAAVSSPYQYSRVKPETIIGLLQAIQVRYGIDVIYAGTRRNAAEIIISKIGTLNV